MTRVVITGAGRGIGYALATGYLNRGWEVWAGCRSPEQAPGLADRGALVHRLDVTDEETIRSFAAAVASAGEVNLLVNAAGTDARALGAAPGRRGPFEIDPEYFLGEMRVGSSRPAHRDHRGTQSPAQRNVP
jgi:NAD(P)-dependent dehydrogenase (short-subunit alcohol dehydrogenase family)